MRRYRFIQFLCITAFVLIAYGDCPSTPEGIERFKGALPVVRNRIIVRPKNVAAFRERGRQVVQKILKTHETIPPIREIGGIGAFVVDTHSFSMEQLLSSFTTTREFAFEWAEPDFIIREMAVPNDPVYRREWGMTQIGAPAAWDTTQGSRDIVVAVIDSGMLLSHPDLADNVWKAPKPFSVTIGTKVIPCLTGDSGYDAVTTSCNPVDGTGHGTFVAGVIGAVGDNGLLFSGVNWRVSLLPLRFIGNNHYGCLTDAVDMLEFSRQLRINSIANVRVVNMSWGLYTSTSSLQSEIALVHAANILLVGAAGNNGQDNDGLNPFYPASYTNDVLSVAATDPSDKRILISNYGRNTVHIGAPGVNIISTSSINPSDVGVGTSTAAPFVAGAAALMMSRCNKLTADGAKILLGNTVDASADLANTTVSGGRLNVAKALAACVAGGP